MQDIQSAFIHIREIRAKQKVIKDQYKDALNSTGEHQQIIDKIKQLRDRKRQIEQEVQTEMSTEFLTLAKLKQDLFATQEAVSSLALTNYVKGETVAVVDEYNNNYEPVFTVRFRKASLH